jgi:hypothetical protein
LEFIPGIGVKFFFDNKPSEDLVAMESLAGQYNGDGTPNRHYFAYDFTTNFTSHSPVDATGDTQQRYQNDPQNFAVMKVVGQRFQEALNQLGHPEARPFWRSTTNLAAFNPDGSVVPTANAPSALIFKATSKVKGIDAGTWGDFRYVLFDIGGTTQVFDVYAQDGGQSVKIGELYTNEAPVPSAWGDRSLFFRHSVGAGAAGANGHGAIAANQPRPDACTAAGQ